MHIIARIILSFAIISLVACVNHKDAVRPAQEVASCKLSCEQRFNTCTKVCHNNCPQCQSFSQHITTKNYRRYVHEQCVQGGFITRQLNSYRDPLQCRKTTCNCSADYRVCIQSCAGVIHKRLQVAPTCC